MKILKGFFAILILLIALLALAYFYSGSLLKKGITKAGPAIAGVAVDLESIAADPIRGNVAIDQLVIHNPEKFKTDFAFKIDNFDFDFDPTSTFKNALHIRELTVDGATVISDGLRADNHRAILKNIRSKIGDKPAKNEKEDPSSKPSGKKLIIDHFSFINSSLAVYVDGEEVTKVDFPNVELDAIGTKGNAVSAAEALAQIYTAIASETTHVLTVNEEVIENIARAKLKSVGIENMEDLKNPEKILKNPEAMGNILEALTKPKKGNGDG